MLFRRLARSISLAVAALILAFGLSNSALALSPFQKSFASDKNPELKILFVGNSILFVGETPEQVVSLIRAANPKLRLKVSEVAGPAYSLQDHIDLGLAKTVIEKSGPWDYVIIQQNTYDMLADTRQTLNASKELVEIIRNAKAKPIFYETMGSGTMKYYEQSKAAAHRVSKKLKMDVLPVATALYSIKKQNRGLMLFLPDLNHYSDAGVYAASCVTYSKIFGKIPTYDSKKKSLIKLSDSDLKLIHQSALDAVNNR